jgi:CRISPR/Cas system-associated exonuclease Cas4 (RecB family)
MSENHIIRASEIGEYVYCHRSWWLRRVHGVRPHTIRPLELGTAYHEAHGRVVQRAVWVRKLAYGCLFTAVVLLTYWLLTAS